MSEPNHKLEFLVRDLHRKRLPREIEQEFFKVGEDAYHFIREKLRDLQLTDLQVINLLQILVKMRFFDDPNIVYNQVLAFTADERIRVRSKSVIIAINLLVQAEEFPDASRLHITRKEVTLVINKALNMGLEKQAAKFANDFLTGKI